MTDLSNLHTKHGKNLSSYPGDCRIYINLAMQGPFGLHDFFPVSYVFPVKIT